MSPCGQADDATAGAEEEPPPPFGHSKSRRIRGCVQSAGVLWQGIVGAILPPPPPPPPKITRKEKAIKATATGVRKLPVPLPGSHLPALLCCTSMRALGIAHRLSAVHCDLREQLLRRLNTDAAASIMTPRLLSSRQIASLHLT